MTVSPAGDKRPTNMWEELNRPKERAADPSPSDEDRNDKAGLGVSTLVGGAVAVVTVALAGFIVVSGLGSASVPESAMPQNEQLALTDSGGSDEGVDDPDPGIDTTVPTVDDTTVESTDDVAEPTEDDAVADAGDTYSPAVPAGAEGNYSVLSRGKLYLRGEIPSPLIEIGAVNALEEILGEGNVIAEYVINPDAPFEMGSASDVFIEDTVLFQFASAEIAPDFYPLLGLGVVLMQVQDGVTIEIYGHTDSAGSDETNLTLSQERVDAVKAFWISQGADASRITAIGRGETEPVADNSTPEGQQLNRRVEIVINGFVFSL